MKRYSLNDKRFPSRTRELLLTMPSARFEGVVTVELVHARTGLIKRRLEFKNLITDAGLNYLGTGAISSAVNFIGVGTSGTAPANSDTALGAEILPRSAGGGDADVYGYVAGPPAYFYRRISRAFTETQANGNLTEFGVFDGSAGGTLWARQLFKDGLGNPTTITKTNQDQLKISYEIRVYPPTVDASGTQAVTGVGNVDWVSRAANLGGGASGWDHFMGSGGGPFGAWTNNGALLLDSQTLGTTAGTPTGASQFAGRSSATVAAYVSGNKYREVEYAWDPAAGTLTGGSVIHTVCFTSAMGVGTAMYQTRLAINPGGATIAKSNLQRLKLTLRYPWDRV